jgi:hypothetical protein
MHAFFVFISLLALLWSSIVVVILVLVLYLQLAILMTSRQENIQRTNVNWIVTGTAGFSFGVGCIYCHQLLKHYGRCLQQTLSLRVRIIDTLPST